MKRCRSQKYRWIMFKNKNNSSNNICGKNVHKYRLENFTHLSQRMLAERLQLAGLDLDKNAIQRIESGQRFVTDIELLALSQTLHVTLDELLLQD